uniref:Guanylate cyclase n=1 Tax=Saccoglossus kowalevskii TaxID=10224 RepID=A0ABM0M928_SACKO|nr:PREDICTED: atrial natriuretic peptide receptor 1-like [Saccoglossus kowalevskii]
MNYVVSYGILFVIVAFFQSEYAFFDPLKNTDEDVIQVQIAVILPKDTDEPPEIRHYPYRFEMVCPAIDIAVNKVFMQGNFFGNRKVNVTIRKVDSRCSNLVSPIRAVEFITERQVDVFFGPACDYAAIAVTRFASHWNIPFITTGAKAKEFGMKEKEDFRTLTRAHGPFLKMAEFMMEILRTFQWNTTAIIHNDKDVSLYRDCWLFGGALFHLFHGAGWYDPGKDYAGYQKFVEDDDPNYTEILQEIVMPNGRIVVICASGETVRKIMLAAHDLGMTKINKETGRAEYAFFNIQLFDSAYFGDIGWKRGEGGDGRDEDAKEAYRSLMTLTLRKPDTKEYQDFAREVKQRALEDYGFDYDKEGEDVNSFVGAFHDAVILYALALNETLEEGGSPRDGKTITAKMWNRTFEGETIYPQPTLHTNNVRNITFIQAKHREKCKWGKVIANYYGTRKKYEPVRTVKIDWPGDTPPDDVPECGFEGELCIEKQPLSLTLIISIVFGSFLFILIIVAFIIYRKWKLEKALADMAWKIRWEEITFNRTKRGLGGSHTSLNSRDSQQSVWDANQQIFTITGMYKNNIVAIKKINKRRVEINRRILKEFKHMRDLQHDHVTRFIGACVEPPNICVMTEYCPKGSLQDILENDSIKLDWMFRYSLAYDIVKGMHYIHSSVINSHGNLKSTNCVVDSRFVLKVTDFGMNQFKLDDEDKDMDFESHQYFQRKLWTSPELLRMTEAPLGGTQKSDVYSFGVILQEIVHRCGPFYVSHMDLSPQVYQKFPHSVHKPAGMFRGINSQSAGNILDNLLRRMEQYANNLESLVEERTEAFYEEKRRAEELLYQVLPKPVAEKLKRGQAVQAEAFDSVTIFFSDIVGFTALSASSTPMEVIALLNDLYTCFDAIIDNFNVYKVETIGDAYMVVSGLPIRNGDFHAREISRMALALLKAVDTFKIRHKPDEKLKLRIGIHSGMVCAGVVGLKMPRYCLFGDTVNTASRMESNGLPLKIHVSKETYQILKTFGSFDIVCRGEVEMKGKGKQLTYWLEGEDPPKQIGNGTTKSNGFLPTSVKAGKNYIYA